MLPKPSRLLPGALMALATALALAIALALATPSAAEAEVQVRTLDDGTHLIFNESTVERQRRQSHQLLPVPKAELRLLIDRYARFFGLAPQLVQAVVQAESGYNVRALSSKGAMGLMQLMPGTAALLGVSNAWDPQQNVRGGSAYLAQQLERFGSVRLAVAAYHAGPNAVAKYKGVPPYPDTQEYVERVLSLYQQNPSEAAVDLARDRARATADAERRHKDVLAKTQPPAGAKVYLQRDAGGLLLLTNTPPPAAPRAQSRSAALASRSAGSSATAPRTP
jgi:hypothetical protein